MLLGPFPEQRPELKRAGVLEHDFHGPVRAVVYTTLRWDHPEVQAAVDRYLQQQQAVGLRWLTPPPGAMTERRRAPRGPAVEPRQRRP